MSASATVERFRPLFQPGNSSWEELWKAKAGFVPSSSTRWGGRDGGPPDRRRGQVVRPGSLTGRRPKRQPSPRLGGNGRLAISHRPDIETRKSGVGPAVHGRFVGTLLGCGYAPEMASTRG